MYRIYLCLVVLFCTLGARAQENLEIKVLNADSKMPMANANVSSAYRRGAGDCR